MTVDAKTQALFEARAVIVKALAHPTRLFIVNELSKGERCVCELREEIGADLSTVSKHLSVLKGAGIVEDDKRGLQVFYRLRCPCILTFFSCVENVLQENARRQRALVNE
ncbi:MAG: metalloregulator ArsR/SmtB family transcription factor [Candidatus Hydrogenedentes bacterium]|nr:metalloregulator ArsR/SmtB family transcription factor [Candidatus Hydrogenedentota bacterium]